MDNLDKNEFIIYGKQPVLEALRSNQRINKIILAKELERKESQAILNLCQQKKIIFSYEKKSNMQRHCGPVLHQGIVAYLESYTYLSEADILAEIKKEKKPFILILDQIQDPHNLGAIIRTAEVAGVTAIILPEKGSAVITNTVAKTSAGAIFHCHICRTSDLIIFIQKIQDQNIQVMAMAPNGENEIFNTDFNLPLALIIGSEGGGVRKNLLTLSNKVISIPGFGKLDSLNASVSSAVVLFEVVRQRRYI